VPETNRELADFLRRARGQVDPSRAGLPPDARVRLRREEVALLLDSLDGEPAMVLGRRTDVLATNRMARALFTDFDRLPPPQRDYARWMFLDEEARSLFVDRQDQARAAVESLRLDVGRDPDHPRAGPWTSSRAGRPPTPACSSPARETLFTGIHGQVVPESGGGDQAG
jgi:MmyB-like transcription regulator ligand binding domain